MSVLNVIDVLTGDTY